MASIFTKIIQGELPCYKLFEDELTISILTLDMINLGHSLVIPKMEVDHWTEVPPEIFARVGANAQKIGRAVRKATGCPRVLTAAIGYEVPHYHLHLIPSWSAADLSFAKARRFSPQEMTEIQNKIIQALI